MKVISLLQPWATLVIIGAKKIETRSWNTKFRGPILIHASKKKDPDGYSLWHSKHCWDRFTNNKHFAELPFGSIVGKADIIESTSTEFYRNAKEAGIAICNESGSTKKLIEEDWEQEFAFGDFSGNRFGWLLKNPVEFINPFKAKGNLGLWNHNELHEEKITCPECREIQMAMVQHTIPFRTYIHDCKKCGYTIMESDWQRT